MPESPSHLTRRALVAGALGGLALAAAGCEAVDEVFGSEDDPGVSGSVTPTAPAADADSALVETTVAAITAAAAVASGTARVRGMGGIGGRLARLHVAHAELLGWSGSVDPVRVASSRRSALHRLLGSEEGLQALLLQNARSAESGSLAQTFASMAAAVAQQRAVLG